MDLFINLFVAALVLGTLIRIWFNIFGDKYGGGSMNGSGSQEE